MVKGFCAGFVADLDRGGQGASRCSRANCCNLDDETRLVSDLGGWGTARGAVWTLREGGQRPRRLSKLLSGSTCRTLAPGADGKVYVGEMSRIFRFDPRAAGSFASIESRRRGPPRQPPAREPAPAVGVRVRTRRRIAGRHRRARPTSAWTRMASASANCARKADPANAPRASVATRPTGHGGWNRDYTIYARGLRNSIALAVHRSGTVLQGENSYDFDDRWHPFDEVNRVELRQALRLAELLRRPDPRRRAGRRPAPSAARVPRTRRSALLLPPHSAPLSLLWYDWRDVPVAAGTIAAVAASASARPGAHRRPTPPTRMACRSRPGARVIRCTARHRVPLRCDAVGGCVRAHAGLGQALRASVRRVRRSGWRWRGDGAIWTTDDRARASSSASPPIAPESRARRDGG